jgi:anti-repressor protein
MEDLQITLANGSVTAPEKLRHYFDTVFAAEDSGQEYPVNLSDVWRIGYAAKAGAVKALQKGFVEGVDFEVFSQMDENPLGGRPEEVYKLTTSCAEYLAVRSNREVFDVYRNCRRAVKNILRGTLPDFSDPIAAARAWADAEEGKKLALARANESAAKLELARPKIEFADAVAVAANSVPMSTAAKYLKLPGIGRNKLFRMLRADKILRANNEPYQQHVDAGYFEVEPQHYKAGEKGERITGTTRVTGRGLAWLQKKYKQPAENI